MPLTIGLHAIINKKSGTSWTASDGPDPRAVTGCQYDETQNQRWLLINRGDDMWEIFTLNSSGAAGVPRDSRPRPESDIFVGSSSLTHWRITHADGYGPDHYHISMEDHDLRVTLANDGSAAPCTPLEIKPPFEELESQVWEFRSLGG